MMAAVTRMRRGLATSAGRLAKELTDRQKQLMARSLPKKRRLEGVDNVVLVASGKGGVGKSTTSVNLALELSTLAGREWKVGILDADVYGPSLPTMLNLEGGEEMRPEVDADGKMIPLVNYGLHCMSMGFLAKQAS